MISFVASVFFLGIACVALVEYAAAKKARARAEQEASVARSQRLAAEAVASAPDDPDLALLLAVRSYRQAATEQALGEPADGPASSRTSGPFFGGRETMVLAMAFDPAGRYLVAGSASPRR